MWIACKVTHWLMHLVFSNDHVTNNMCNEFIVHYKTMAHLGAGHSVHLDRCQMWCNSKAFASCPPTRSFQSYPRLRASAKARIVRTSFSSQLLATTTIPLFLFNLCVARSDGNLLVCIQRLQKWSDIETRIWFQMRPFGILRKTTATKWLEITLNIKYTLFESVWTLRGRQIVFSCEIDFVERFLS